MLKQPTILVIDDDVKILELVEKTLSMTGINVIVARNGREGVAAFDKHRPDLVISDIMMPELDGIGVIRHIRGQNFTPIIMLTAVDQEEEMVKAFSLGADDYLTKPFSLVELLARVKAALRRENWHHEPATENQLIHFGAVEIDTQNRRVRRNGEPVKLTMLEYKLLLELVSYPDRIFTHRLLLQRVWGVEYGDEHQYVRVYIGRLRSKIEEDPSNPCHIVTDPGIGYHLEL